MRHALLILALTATSSPALGQSPDPVMAASHAIEQEVFITRARAATEQYHDLREAIAAGYRKVGPDMPNMGEHWIRIRHVLQGSVTPEEPTVLTYLRVNGRPVLTGAAYTVAVMQADEAPPSPVEGAEWHFHAGSIQEEVMGHGHGESGPRLGMIHAWIWAENPDGPFTADNWALPFIRRGLSVPDQIDPAAAKALFLLDGGVDYYGDLIQAAAGSTRPAARRLLEEFRARVSDVAHRSASNKPQKPDGSVSVERLAELWRDLWKKMAEHLDESTLEALHTAAH